MAAPATEASLALHEAAARVQQLLRERARLLRDVQKKKLQLAQARQKAARESQEALTRVAPLMQRHQNLLRELSALFDELLAEGRLATRARNQIARLRRSLELRGVLHGRDDFEHDFFDDHEDKGAAPPPRPGGAGAAAQRASPRNSRGEPPPEPFTPELASARQVGQERRSIRELFRNLARAVHPDQARQEPDRVRRTEVMKELTRAYEEGDLARLLELEATWQTEQVVAETSEPVARCQELERINRELLKQVRQLTREVRDTKRDAREESRGLPPDELVEQATFELDALQELCNWLQRFRDGKMTLVELRQRCR